MMIETFLALLAAHLVSDFALQWDKMVKRKRELRILLAHVGIVGASALIVLGARTGSAVAATGLIIATHLAIDYWKVRSKDSLATFTLDQLAHLMVIAAVALIVPGLAADGFWSLLPGDAQATYYRLLAYLSGFILAVPFGGIVIKKLISPLVPPGAPDADGARVNSSGQTFPNAGRYIGWLERALAFGFILVNQPQGVGFLLAAKSVLRFGDVNNPHQRSHAEYIIIGTLLSFGWAMVTAYVAVEAASHWAS